MKSLEEITKIRSKIQASEYNQKNPFISASAMFDYIRKLRDDIAPGDNEASSQLKTIGEQQFQPTDWYPENVNATRQHFNALKQQVLAIIDTYLEKHTSRT